MSNNAKSSKGLVEHGRPAALALLQKGRVDEADVALLRREMMLDRSPSRIEIEDLFGLDAVLRPDLDAWAEFFVEVVTDHVVWDQRPTGVLDDKAARWLVDKVEVSRTVSSFAILVNILEEAHSVPRWFEKAVRLHAVTAWPSLMSSVEKGASAHL